MSGVEIRPCPLFRHPRVHAGDVTRFDSTGAYDLPPAELLVVDIRPTDRRIGASWAVVPQVR